MIVDEPEKLDLLTKEIPQEYLSKFSIMRSSDIFLEFVPLELIKA